MRIYLAVPYSHKDPAVREERFNRVNSEAANLFTKGHMVFSPISHTHPIALAGDLPGNWEFWEAYDRTMIEWCDQVWVLAIEGWNESK